MSSLLQAQKRHERAGDKEGVCVFIITPEPDAAANAIMLSQELGLRPKTMPSEALIAKFTELVNVGSSSA